MFPLKLQRYNNYVVKFQQLLAFQMRNTLVFIDEAQTAN